MNPPQTLTLTLAASFFLLGAAAAAQQQSPSVVIVDPDILDAEANGAGYGDANDSESGSAPKVVMDASPLGGRISVLDESSLPPLGSESGQNRRQRGRRSGGGGGGGGGPSISAGGSGSSGGIMIPIMGGGSGGSPQNQSLNLPTSMPPSSQSPMNMPGSQSSPGKMPQGGSPPPSLDNLPPAPGEQAIGDPSAQINGAAAPDEAPEGLLTGEDPGVKSGQQSGRQGKQAGGAEGKPGESETDGQEMPENIGGRQGSKRGTGTEKGETMSNQL